MPSEISNLLEFLNSSPTAWHAVAACTEKLKTAGFTELKEESAWNIQPGQKYFVTRNGSSLCAFIAPSGQLKHAKILASHTDSPALKLKPNAEFYQQNMIMIGVEVYGAPLLTSWLNRDLGIAGRIFYLDSEKKMKQAVVNLSDHSLTIPQLAIHLDREVNEKGLVLNKQEHLAALAAINTSPETKINYLETLLKQQVNFTTLLGYDLFLYPLEPARLLGFQKQMIASYRIDSLVSVHAALAAILETNSHDNQLSMTTFWDNEEVGSGTSQGAESPFLPQLIERICLSISMSREEYLRVMNRSLCISVDLGHALHPNYPEKHEPRHQPLLGKGVLLKSNAQQRYITDGESGALIAQLCHQHGLPLQKFVNRTDIPCGSTIGPIHATLTGMKTVDIGCAQLSMHSARELMACDDYLAMRRLLQLMLKS